MASITNWIPRFWRSKISTFGVASTTISGLLLIGAIAADLVGEGLGLYPSAFIYLVLPMFFIGGLLLIPLGLILRRRAEAKGGKAPPDGAVRQILRTPRVRRTLIVLGVATIVNVIVVGSIGTKAVHYMETPEFCGMLCHEIMEPEYRAYQRSPHARVACVECHVGSGAKPLVESKINGLRQVWHAMRGDYQRPIHAPVDRLRPAEATCQECHRPDRMHGNRMFARAHYEEDRENAVSMNVLTLHLGGKNALTGAWEGVHWHARPGRHVRYEALDDKRGKIGRIEVLEEGKVVRTYLPAEAGGEVHEVRTMDCIDCHNRPTHQFDGTVRQALDLGFSMGLLDPQTPFLNAVGAKLLERTDRSRDDVEAAYEKELRAAYAADHADVKLTDEAFAKAAGGLAELYRRNIWPRMKIGWNTYPSHIGHSGENAETQGCFRCHDEEHKTAEGKLLSQDCSLCHEQLVDEEAPEDIDEGLRALLFGAGEDDD